MQFTKIALIVEYDGTAYHGFQVQRQSPTVQEKLEEAVRSFTGESLRARCASRTDAGVHAKGQVVSFQTQTAYPPATWVSALNHFLPNDVGVQAAYKINEDYDIRKRAIRRRYKYVILNRATESPLLRERSYWVPMAIDLERANEAAEHLIGERDFGPFSGALDRKDASTVRCLYRATFRRDGDIIDFEVEGSSFLPQQVRRMTGALLEVGLGKTEVRKFQKLADSGNRGSARPTLPSRGLSLEEVYYRDFPPTQDAIKEELAGKAHEFND